VIVFLFVLSFLDNMVKFMNSSYEYDFISVPCFYELLKNISISISLFLLLLPSELLEILTLSTAFSSSGV